MTLTNDDMSAPPPLWREWRIVLLLLALSILYNVPFYLPFFSAEARQPGVFVTGHDWDIHYFYHAVVYRSVVDFHEWPFWNPWNLGGSSMWGNPQTPFPTPMFLVTLVFGLLNGVRLQVLLHHFVGLLGMFWMARRLGLTRPAAVLAASIFMLSTWYSLHLATGHANFWPAAYMPWTLGCLHAAVRRMTWAVGAAAWLALIVFEGGHHIFLIFFVMAGFLALGWAIQRRSWRPLLALVLIVVFSGGFSAVRLAPEVALLARYPRPTIPGGQTYEKLRQDLESLRADPLRGSPTLEFPPPEEMATPAVDAAKSAALSGEPTMAWTGSKALAGQLAKIFLGREQESNKIYFRYQGHGWHEYGAYIGPLALLLLACFMFGLRRHWPWVVAAAICFLISSGNFMAYSPWTLLHKLPIYEQFRVPSRYLIPTVLCLAMVAAVVFDELWRRAAARKPRRVALAVLLALAIADLTWVGGGAFRNEKEHNLITTDLPRREIPVTVGGGSKRQQLAFLLRNYRTSPGSEAIPIVSHALPENHAAYHGEFYVVANDAPTLPLLITSTVGSVEQLEWSPGRIALQPKINPDFEGWLMLNMNWDAGWRARIRSGSAWDKAAARDGLVELTNRQPESRGGALAVRLHPGDTLVLLTYIPPGLYSGLAVTGATLLIALIWLYLARHRERQFVVPAAESKAA
jgi:hypothetical protein